MADEITEEGLAAGIVWLTADDIEMMRFVTTLPADDIDYAAFFEED